MESKTSPFHRGEQAVQTRLGVRREIEPWAQKVVKPWLPDQHRDFYAGLTFLVVAALDESDRPWATVLAGVPGFASSPDPLSLRVAAQPAHGDALDGALSTGAEIGLLGLEFDSRRRNRVNGVVNEADSAAFTLGVAQAFGNCPQYIHPRSWEISDRVRAQPGRRAFGEFAPEFKRWIESADTFFIASGYRGEGDNPAFGMDASHRGGEAGFVRVRDRRTLVFPDYSGNNHFNTLGNLLLNPGAGLTFVDFQGGHLLQLTGNAKVEWEPKDLSDFPGARRLVVFELDQAVELRGALPLRWKSDGETIRQLRVVAKVPESRGVTSFYLERRDGTVEEPFHAGQHLPLELEIPGTGQIARRTYSLSNAPDLGYYRITVKREEEGLVSSYLHDGVSSGDFLDAQAPGGAFVVDSESPRPAVLLGAGVGVTPLVSMFHELARKKKRAWLVHGVRDGEHHPLGEEIQKLASESSALSALIVFSRPRENDVRGRDFDAEGRIDVALLESFLPSLDADYYLCGPVGFMSDLQATLEERGVPSQQIHSESFAGSGA